jgi:endonuclease-3 related protein
MPSPRRIGSPGTVSPDVTQKLRVLYGALRAHFGYVPRWWPGTPWEITLSAILVQQCDWTVAHRGTQRLIEAGFTGPRELAQARPADVQEGIRSIAFAPTKAGRLIDIARHLQRGKFSTVEQYLGSADTDALRHDLLSLHGIGDETADAILLYAGASHSTFVVDAYTRRILSRVGLSHRLDDRFWKGPARRLRQFLREHVLADLTLYSDFKFDGTTPREVALLRDYHAQLVELGRHHCLKSRPRCHSTGKHGWTDYEFCREHCLSRGCGKCPLSGVCAFAVMTGFRAKG